MDFLVEINCIGIFFHYMRFIEQVVFDPKRTRQPKEAPMTRDELNRELRMHSATWQAVVLVYGVLVGTLVFSAMAIVG